MSSPMFGDTVWQQLMTRQPQPRPPPPTPPHPNPQPPAAFPAQTIDFFILNNQYPLGRHGRTWKPTSITSSAPIIKRPPFPSVTSTSLHSIDPCIFFVSYGGCSKTHCRSMGICVHYQFVLGARRCPDGLICEMCEKVGTAKQAMMGERMCPAHQLGGKKENQWGCIGSRPEDFLPTGEQRVVCEEVLRRSVKGEWEGVDCYGRQARLGAEGEEVGQKREGVEVEGDGLKRVRVEMEGDGGRYAGTSQLPQRTAEGSGYRFGTGTADPYRSSEAQPQFKHYPTW